MASETTAAPPLADPDDGGIIGEVKIWVSDTLPSARWDWCDGGLLSRTTHSRLFALLGEDWGAGDGSTTFAKPNFDGKFLVGKDAADTDFDQIGKTGGSKASNMPAHTHGAGTLAVSPNPHNHTGPPTSNIAASGTAIGTPLGGGGGGGTTSSTNLSIINSTDSQGSGSATNGNLPPFATVRFIIKIL